MSDSLSLLNWSLKKALNTQVDSFTKARINIIFTILLLSLLKAAIVLGLGAANGQWLQVVRAGVAFSIYICLLKILLYRPSKVKLIAHFMILVGILVVYTNIFIYTHQVNLVTVQFAFMIMLGGFYTLGSTLGFIYSVIGLLPILLTLISGSSVSEYFTSTAHTLSSPGREMIATLNFISILICHYLFYRAFHTNIREKERLNQQLQLAIEDANNLAQSKTNFLSTMSHELRTPLNSVVGLTELLLEDKPEERQKENLKILQLSAQDLLSLINNILDFNKIDSDKLVLEKVQFGLGEFIRNTCATLQVKAREKHLNFVIDIDRELEKVNVISDPTRLSQLIYNLAGNAIKFTDKGSVTVKLERLHKSNSQVDILFSVTDTGIGIHPDKHDLIFDLFTQAESYTTRKYGGTGLGLAIVRQILSLFNSTLQLESSPGKGAKFFFTLSMPVVTEVTEAKPMVKKEDLSHLKILIAEDNDINRLLMKKQMDKLNIQAVIAENGQLAFDAYLLGDYDAIFMDLHMPVADGYETTGKIRAMADPAKANVYIIAFTASVTEQQKIFENGFDDFLYKPVNLNDLYDKLEKIAMRDKVTA